jgi:ATPase family associated with various cellular activities (AAA)
MNDVIEEILANLGDLVIARVHELERREEPQTLDLLLQGDAILHVLGSRLGVSVSLEEAVILMTALVPHLQPHLLDEAIASALSAPADHPRIGGVRGKDSRSFLPTVETLMLLLGAQSVVSRMSVLALLDETALLAKHRLVYVGEATKGEPITGARLEVGDGVIERLLKMPKRRPKLGPEFPAQRIETELAWDDLVLDARTRREIGEIETWIRFGGVLREEWGMHKYIKPGYRALFFGPSGTGKTQTASLLGKQTGRDVYRIDLSMIVSKFIGETEKNLSRIFDQAEAKDWILFFDEADALFGKRTNVKDAHDRYANQEVSYLLQRVEIFDGLVILASNFRNNIDEAFLRRFQAVIHFPRPNAEERMRLWQRMLPEQVTLGEEVSLGALCKRHELTGASIASIIQYASLRAMGRGETCLRLLEIEEAINREYEKEGKIG